MFWDWDRDHLIKRNARGPSTTKIIISTHAAWRRAWIAECVWTVDLWCLIFTCELCECDCDDWCDSWSITFYRFIIAWTDGQKNTKCKKRGVTVKKKKKVINKFPRVWYSHTYINNINISGGWTSSLTLHSSYSWFSWFMMCPLLPWSNLRWLFKCPL